MKDFLSIVFELLGLFFETLYYTKKGRGFLVFLSICIVLFLIIITQLNKTQVVTINR